MSKLPTILVTGDERIDREHEELLEACERVRVALTTDDVPDAVEVLSWLNEHLSQHVLHEESLMEAIGYPFQMTHKASHGRFVRLFRDLHLRSQRNDDPRSVLLDLLAAAMSYLNEHILDQDVALARYIHRGSANRATGARDESSRAPRVRATD